MRDTELPADSLYLIGHDAYGRPRGRRKLDVGLGACLLGEMLALGVLERRGDEIVPVVRPPFVRHSRHDSPFGGACQFSLSVIHGGLTCPRCRRAEIQSLTCPDADCRAPLQGSAVCPGCYNPAIEEVPEQLQREIWQMINKERFNFTVAQWLTVLGRHARYEVGRRLARGGWLRAQQYRSFPKGDLRERYVVVDSVLADMPRQTLRRIANGKESIDDHRRLVAGIADAVGLLGDTLTHMPADETANLLRQVHDLSPDLRYLIDQTRASVDGVVMVHAG